MADPRPLPVRGTIAAATTVVALAMLLALRPPDGPGTDGGLGGSDPPVARRPAGPAPTPDGSGRTYATQVTVTGRAVGIPWGTVQVEATLVMGIITDVHAVRLPRGDGRSAEISDIVGPRLGRRVLQAQSAEIDTISGATWTSKAYIRSLQSALDQARG